MKRSLFTILIASALACGASEGINVDQAVTIARELRVRPDDAEKILAQHQLSEAQWEALMYEIAGDPAMAATFATGVQN